MAYDTWKLGGGTASKFGGQSATKFNSQTRKAGFLTPEQWAGYQNTQYPATAQSSQWWMGTTTPATDYATQVQNNPYLSMFLGTGNTSASNYMNNYRGTSPWDILSGKSTGIGSPFAKTGTTKAGWNLDPSFKSPTNSLIRRYVNPITGETKMVY